MKELVIQRKENSKGRSFAATPVAMVTADNLFPEGGTDGACRPVWAMFAGAETSLRPFVANLRLGRKAEPDGFSRKGDGERFEFLKSIGYHIAWQKEAEGCLATLYHPELFRLDPGMVDPEAIQFVMLVPEAWIASQAIDPTAAIEHMKHFRLPELEGHALASWAVAAYLFAAYLDRRTRCPLITDGRFYLQLLCQALDRKLASFPGSNLRYNTSYRSEWGYQSGFGFRAEGLENAGISLAIAFQASHDTFEQFIAEQVTIFFDITEGRISERVVSNG